MDETITDDNIFHILIATDIHLGYLEDHPIRGEDTFVTFEEILQRAARENVDFILLGGDLFHDAKPSNYCINKCIELIKRHCCGDKPVKFATLSDQSYNFLTAQVNYEDPNINISIPIFSIHGNHDDPIGRKQISSMNLLSTCGLINYFGYWPTITNIDVHPILLQKGTTKVCLYGLSHVKDQRLARLFLDGKVVWKTLDNDNNLGWFNIFVLHQNRADRGIKNFIPDTAIPDFIDLCIWGHEHDCRINPTEIGRTSIIQPGSSVATSLSQGEAIKKCIGIVHIYRDQFKLDTYELRTVRPFIHGEISFSQTDSNQPITVVNVESMVKEKLGRMLAKANNLQRQLKNPLPLVRLIVNYNNDKQIFNTVKFMHQYLGVVANDDVIKFVSIKTRNHSRGGQGGSENGNSRDDHNTTDHDDLNNIDDYLNHYLTGTDELSILSVKGLNEAIRRYVNTKDSSAIPDIINFQIQETLKQFNNLQPSENEIEATMEKLKTIRAQNEQTLYEAFLNDPNRPKSTVSNSGGNDENDNDDDDDDDGGNSSSVVAATKPRGGRGSRKKRGQ